MERYVDGDLYHFGYRTTCEEASEFALHCHSCFELYYFVSGSVDYTVEGQRYRLAPGSLLLFAPGVVHGVKPGGGKAYCRYAFHFYKGTIPQEFRQSLLSSFSAVRAPLECPSLRVSFERVLNGNNAPEAIREAMVKAELAVLLGEIYRLCENEQPREPADAQAERIILYLNRHLTEHVCAAQAAGALYLSKSQVNRIFRRATGTTVGSYVRLKRVALARRLIREGVPITEAALEAGFEDYSTFYRSHVKCCGCSPTVGENQAESVLPQSTI